MLKAIFRWIMAIFFMVAGINHFISPKTYIEIMPHYLPWHFGLIYVSGAAEVVLGMTALIPRFRVLAGWGLIALLLTVFPANIQMAIHGFHSVPHWILWARLPLQFVLIAWVYWCCLTDQKRNGDLTAG